MAVHMVHDRTETGVTSVWSGRCNALWKLNGKSTNLLIFMDNIFQKTGTNARYTLLGEKEYRVSYPPPPFESMVYAFVDEISHGRIYGKKNSRHVDRRTDKGTNRRTDRHTRHTDIQDRQTYKTDRCTRKDTRIDMQTVGQTDLQKDRQKVLRTDERTYRQRDG